MEENIKKYLKDIVELIEDDNFPARRNITDYIELIIEEINYNMGKEATKYISELYEKYDKIK